MGPILVAHWQGGCSEGGAAPQAPSVCPSTVTTRLSAGPGSLTSQSPLLTQTSIPGQLRASLFFPSHTGTAKAVLQTAPLLLTLSPSFECGLS